MNVSEFDAYADDYVAALARGLSVTGEGADFYAAGRVTALAGRLGQWSGTTGPLSPPIRRILDFGCGTGGAIPLLGEHFPAAQCVGIDPSQESLRVAATRYASDRCSFQHSSIFEPCGNFDLVHCNGVFHHIDPAERPTAAKTIFESLGRGGWFGLWENNPWNPGTRLVMRRIPFDRDAIPLSYRESMRLLRNAGFQIVAVDFCFYFPRPLALLRPLERWLRKLPLGGQYCVYARKPS